MEEGERKIFNEFPASQNESPTSSYPTTNGKPREKSQTGHGGGNSSEGFAGIAAMMFSSKVKGQGASRIDKKQNKHNGCVDDLPLGSEAHSLSLDQAAALDRKYSLPDDKRSKWPRTASQGIMGWQSFNSDVSNQTSASSASLEQLLNDRQVDPEEMLMSLGFGGQPQAFVPTLDRVPERFLNHPSRAYGIIPPALSEELEEDVGDDTEPAVPGRSAAATHTTAGMPPAKKRTGIWTLARTLSMLRMRTPSRGHISPSSHSNGTQPLTNHPVSILHPANQKYLASRGFYEKQGWPRGSFAEPEEDSLRSAKENEECKDAASKRKMFKKTKSRRNWSMCDSGENEAVSGGGEWITKSVDDSKSPDDFMGRDDSLGHGGFFSTTTESSTDSLDTPNLETERAFENIRREYNESRRREYSSSDDLFLPSRKQLGSGDMTDHTDSLGLDLLNTASTNYFVSPASSRQTTVEKAPSINLADDGDAENKKRDDVQGQQITPSPGSDNKRDHVYHVCDDSSGEVRIIISTSEGRNGKSWSHDNTHENKNVKFSKLTVEGTQTTSSDSGSSSSATAVGSSTITVTADEVGHRRLSESENSVTDRDSISRTNSPFGFTRFSDSAVLMISNSCQTTESDFNMAAAIAGNRHVNVSTLTTSNRSLLQVLVNRPTQDRRKRECAFIEQSPRVQLSTFPPTINHLELMKRLQHSQNDLSRMGSVQSDSSGFGDVDPAVPETDTLKIGGLGSSVESCRTTASNATTVIPRPTREEIATQTSLDSCRIKTFRESSELSIHAKQSPRPAEQGHRYVTMCYIPTPTLVSRRGSSDGLRHRGRPTDFLDHYPDGTFVAAPVWRSRSGSDPRRGSVVSDDDQGYTRPWLSIDSDTEYIRYESSGHHPYSNRYGSLRFHPDRNKYEASSLLYKYPRLHSDVDDHRRAEFHSATSRYSKSMVSDMNSSQRKFTSQIDLYTNAAGFSRREVPSYSHPVGSPRRHSDEGILEGRNNTPLSVELAQARGSGVKTPIPPHSSPVTARTFNASATTKTYHSSRDTIPRSTSSTIHGINSVVATPSHYKTEAGFHYPPIAGNISGLHSSFSDKPIDSSTRISRSTSQQRSCDIIDDDFQDRRTAPSQSRMSDDLDTSSQMTENSSDLSVQSVPESHTKARVLESHKLARLINQPIHFRGTKRCGSQYRPSHQFKDWSLISKRKRMQEENRLLQAAIQKYKTELTIMEASFMVDYQTVYTDMTDQEREEAEELEWLWGEVKVQVLELEHLLTARIKDVHAGNEFYSLVSCLGITKRMVELIKEQICQQQMASARTEDGRDMSLDDDLDIFGDEVSYQEGRHGSFQISQSWLAGMGRMSTPRPIRRFQSSSTSSLPHDVNLSLEQIKSSVMSQVKNEIKESTKKLELDLQEKDRELKRLQEQLLSRTLSTPDSQTKRWTPRRSSHRVVTKPRSHLMTENAGQETDV